MFNETAEPMSTNYCMELSDKFISNIAAHVIITRK